ncbi:unnamed protein product [Schistosoma turkestanicum]|nr:unnamed protein product [Schistosoma turkestanicum]
MLSNMQAKLTCIMEERDLLVNRLNELTVTSSNNNNNHNNIPSLSNTTTTSQPSTVTITEDLSSLSMTAQTSTTTTAAATVASSISRPIMGLNHRSVQMKSNGNNNLSYCLPTTTHHPPMSSTTTTTTEVLMSKQQTNAEQNATDQLHITNFLEHDNIIPNKTTNQSLSNNNVYDLPEPEWISWTLKQFETYHQQAYQQQTQLKQNSSNELSSTDKPSCCFNESALPLNFEQFLLFDQFNDEETTNFSPNALMAFLLSLAQYTPYTRLSELAQCAQLTLYRLLTRLARYRTDCLVLQANLAEIKSNADQMQCQLSQLESNWFVMKHALQLSESALEISDCLNQLYSTELAVTIFRQLQPNNSLVVKHPFSTISSSTSSSSVQGGSQNKSSQLKQSQPAKKYHHSPPQLPPQLPSHQQHQQQQISFSTTSSCQLYSSIGGGSSEEHDPLNTTNNNMSGQSQPQQISSMNLNTLKLLRQQIELIAYTILDKYETSDGDYEKIPLVITATNTTTNPITTVANATATPNLLNMNLISPSLNNDMMMMMPPNLVNNAHLLSQQKIQQQLPPQSAISPSGYSIQSVITSSNGCLLDNNHTTTTTTTSTSSTTNNNISNINSLYANSWYVSLNRDQFTTTTQQYQLINEIGDRQHFSLPAISLNPHQTPHQQQQFTNPHLRSIQLKSTTLQGNTNQHSHIIMDGYGWETPDSGAGSSSINELSSSHQQPQNHQNHNHQQQNLFLSSSTSSLHYGHDYQTYGVIHNNNNNNHTTNMTNISSKFTSNTQPDLLLLLNTLIDQLPPLWTLFTKTASTSFYESDLESSDSSELPPGNFMKTTPTTNVPPMHRSPHHQHQHAFYKIGNHHQHHHHSGLLPQLPPTTTPHQHQHQHPCLQLSNHYWSRLEERKLRTVYYQCIQAYKRLQIMLKDYSPQTTIDNHEINGMNQTVNMESDIILGKNTNSEQIKTVQHQLQQQEEDLSEKKTSFAVNSLQHQLPLAVFLESSILLQELCCVKEECADLKIRVYLLEKELHANQLTLDSRKAAEHALRAHLNVLIMEKHQQQQHHHECFHSMNDCNKDNSVSVQPTTTTPAAASATSTTATTTTTTTTVQSIHGLNQHETILLRGQVKNLLQALEALRSSTEIQQLQSETLVNDLKRANSALIKAFDKIKQKYTTRIKKLENQLNSIQSSTTTTTTPTTTTTDNNHFSSIVKGCKIQQQQHHHHINDLNNLSSHTQLHTVLPMKSGFQQGAVVTTTTLAHSTTDSIRDLPPTTRIPPNIPLHHPPPPHPHSHHQHNPLTRPPQQPQQQPMRPNTPKLGTTPPTHQHPPPVSSSQSLSSRK